MMCYWGRISILTVRVFFLGVEEKNKKILSFAHVFCEQFEGSVPCVSSTTDQKVGVLFLYVWNLNFYRMYRKRYGSSLAKG